MNKGHRLKKFSKKIAILLIVALSCNSFAAAVSDNDGSAFITKAEFDSLKNDFQSQLNQYNTSIDAKLDEAIAAYLAGVKVVSVATISAYVRVSDKFDNTIVSDSGERAYRKKQMRYNVSFNVSKFDSSGSLPQYFPIVPTGGTGDNVTAVSYTFASAVVKHKTSNVVFKTKEKDPYVVNGMYEQHAFNFTGGQTFALGWIAIHSRFAWRDSTSTYKLGKKYDVWNLYDAAASNLTDSSKNDAGVWWDDTNDWSFGFQSYNPKKHANYNKVDDANKNNNSYMIFSSSLSGRHQWRDARGNMIFTESAGIPTSDYIIFNQDDIDINIWNEKDEYMEQYTERATYSETDHSKKYWNATGSKDTAIMYGEDNKNMKMFVALRMPFMKPKQTHTTTELKNLKDVYDGKFSDLTGVKQHFCGGLPLCAAPNGGTLETSIKLAGTSSGFSGNIMVEIAGEPFPRGFEYSNDFKKKLVKINGQKEWSPVALTQNKLTKLKWNCEKGKIYYMRFYEDGKYYGGKVTYLEDLLFTSEG